MDKNSLKDNKKSVNLLAKITGFFQETRVETKRVTWPSQRYVMVATAIILLIVAVLSVYLMFLDYLFGKGITYIIQAF